VNAICFKDPHRSLEHSHLEAEDKTTAEEEAMGEH
jgi:hypothetical protein